MRYLLVGLLLAASTANAVPVRYEIAGAITSVSTVGATIPSPFAVGQSVSGWYEIDWDNAQGPFGPGGGIAIFTGLVSYSLDFGPIQFGSNYPAGSDADVVLNDNIGGSTDLMRLIDLVPEAANHALGRRMFDEIFMDLFDFTGTGFGNSQATLDPSKFNVGTIYATGQANGYSGLAVNSIVTVRSVPEPSTLALMFGGLGAALLLRRRSKKSLPLMA